MRALLCDRRGRCSVIRTYLLSMEHHLEIHLMRKVTIQWSMRPKALEA
jgi:hypothetical protein